ncbi:MAG: ABC transporter ATP-binding protein [Candidatus Eremiobacteraeota bacterium]|nr:ABC transporter ATP-binding protein [Candidatus Eremiobacteraeota bacterium]
MRLRVAARTLLDDVTLDVQPGELVAIVGPNGVGKTTLLRAMGGFARPAGGRIVLDGNDIAALRASERARMVTLIGSDAETPAGTTVHEVVATGRFARRAWWDWSPRDDDEETIVTRALERVGLRNFSERYFETLSSGEKQRAWLALALAQDARIVLLDEPTSHLDPRAALEVARVIRTIACDATTAIVVTHDLNEAAAIADRIAVLGDETLLRFAAPDDALDPDILARAYGISFERLTVDGGIRVIPHGYRAQPR